MLNDLLEVSDVKRYKERAEELGISLTEYLLIRVLDKLDDLSVTTYSGD